MAFTCADARSAARNGCRRSRTMAAPAAARAARSRSYRSRRSCVPKNAATSAGYVDASPVARRSARTPSSAAASRWPTGVPSTSNCSRCDRSSATAASRAAGARERQHEIEHGRKRLRAERQRVERLVRQTRVGEHLVREEIRQRAMEHDRDRIGRAAPSSAQSLSDVTSDVAQLLFPIAADEDRGLAARRQDEHGGAAGSSRHDSSSMPGSSCSTRSRNPASCVSSVTTTSSCATGQPAEQVEIGRPQAPGIGGMIRDRDDDVIERQRRLQRDQTPPEHVLVPSPLATTPRS